MAVNRHEFLKSAFGTCLALLVDRDLEGVVEGIDMLGLVGLADYIAGALDATLDLNLAGVSLVVLGQTVVEGGGGQERVEE